ncbi:PolC-type DNA polymerase III [Bulleidia sp. zg-1006]|uniref:PolC-type DNA polymerase III n=1 Tax=Bulleidia sp. zg-1006 TaxID=2806552 RepID=UPI001939F1C0|nr:PolC-type DNA polymerase III [Bulleidia sp. zg-1006]QRG87398.1 PolC-type DNA polymerase III [Bulleidia sp. zg-1006]
MKLIELLDKLNCTSTSTLEKVDVLSVRFYKQDQKIEIELKGEEPCNYDCFQELETEFLQQVGLQPNFFFHWEKNEMNVLQFESYVRPFFQRESDLFVFNSAEIQIFSQQKSIQFSFLNPQLIKKGEEAISSLRSILNQIGLEDYGISIVQQEAPTVLTEKTVILDRPILKEEKLVPVKKVMYKSKKSNAELIRLDEDVSETGQIYFEAEVFQSEIKELRGGKQLQTLSVYDGHGAIHVKRFSSDRLSLEQMEEIHVGSYVRVQGRISYDTFAKENSCIANSIEIIDQPKQIVDTAEKKRIEFHSHTNFSEMDGVCSPKEMIQYAWNLGHEGIVLSDHANVQSFVKAKHCVEDLHKKDPKRSFNVGFGCELNLVEDDLCIVRNANDEKLDEATYVVFDLETTGLSAKYDHMIEFGAVRIKNGLRLDSKQLFIKPPISIPSFIERKTNISNEMVENEKNFSEVVDELLAYIGDAVLVAHNASFDYPFFNEELRRLGRKALNNPVIDTLDLARAILPDRSRFALEYISNHYKLNYSRSDAHRADYDANILADAFEHLIVDAKRQFQVETICDLQEKVHTKSDFKRMFSKHAVVIAKNQAGLKALYDLISISNTETLAVKTKNEGSNAIGEPRIKRSTLQKYRENLLIGSACLNGEVFEMACNGDDNRLKKTMAFYDYIELQPLANYSTSLELGSIINLARLKDVQRRIISCAKELNLPIIATSDCHYCKKEEKIFRDIYITAKGVGGGTHPLYIRNEQIRRHHSNPDQHLRLTNEMIEEFSWLEDEQLVHEMVVDTPKKLFKQIEEIEPVPKGTYPPIIEGSDDKLRELCQKTVMEQYGFEGKIPDLVQQRLDNELDNIIRNGFGVHYYIASLLVMKTNEDGYVVGSRGSVGSSFAATMSHITEVNPLPPHYLCPNCHYSEFFLDGKVLSGFDLEDQVCPHCHTIMRGNGHNIPFQTFLGFNADKTPDIDLNFSDLYQAKAHNFIKDYFGEEHAFRAGTIGTVAEKTAFGYVKGYEEEMNVQFSSPMKEYLAMHCQDVKRTTGQHPGGIVIVPKDHVVEDFTPIQYPSNQPGPWKTTHFEYHDYGDQILKFDILGHVDPTSMRLLQEIATVKPMDIPMNDAETLSLFYEDKALKADPRIYHQETGAVGLPEFGTANTRRVLQETKPHTFSDLTILSGLTHGTDVWAGNAEERVKQGFLLKDVIGCRDDIMTYLLDKKLEPLDAFKIMEGVRKGKGLTEAQEKNMREHQVPDWYIDSCKKIKYMFPKAHAVAYVMMAVRIAWYKVHEPINFYIQYLTLRCDAYDIAIMSKGLTAVRMEMERIKKLMDTRDPGLSNKDKALFNTLEICEEMYARGYSIENVNLYESLATRFKQSPSNPNAVIPPFVVIDSLGESVAENIVQARQEGEFLSKEDLLARTHLSKTLLQRFEKMGIIQDLNDTNQLSLFD